MKKVITLLVGLWTIVASAQSVTGINPNQAHQGQSLSTSITSSALFTVGSSPQGNIQNIILKNATDSAFAVSDSINVVNTNTAKTFWNIPIGIATGLYNLVVRIYNSVTHIRTDYTLSNAFTITLASVWPGDADANSIVDNADLLAIGLAYDSTGATRTGASILWLAQSATDWRDTLPGGANFKHADCNGDGIVNANDTVAIIQNFSLTHNKTNTPKQWRSGIPGITFQLSKDTVVNGDTVIVKILLGDSATSVSNIYGLAFDFNYDPIPFDSNTAFFAFSHSWFGDSTNSITIRKLFKSSGTVKASITGINHLNRSGHGEIAKFRAVITTGNINGKNLSYYTELFNISNVKATDIKGNPIPLNEGIDSIKVGYIPTGIIDSKYTEYVSAFPNPASTRLHLSCASCIKEISLIDMNGNEVYAMAVADRKHSVGIDVANLEAGIYFVKVTTEHGMGITKILITK